MISFASLLTYLTVNGGLMFLSIFQYLVLSKFKFYGIIKYLIFLIKNILITITAYALMYYNKKKYKIENNLKYDTPVSLLNGCGHLLLSTFAEYLTFNMLNPCDQCNIISGCLPTIVNTLCNFLMFVPISFVFEVVFDFFHYWAHRILHMSPYLYKNIHKTHHTHINVTPIVTFIQHPIDLLLSNVIPSCFAYYITNYFNGVILGKQINLFILICILTYKTYIEVMGHTDIKTQRSSSFVQFIWITRALNISLFPRHHIIHHTHVTKNFSKRFSLYDKLFGTFKDN